jgi:DHA3 family tetracycline resistance protein-like MFS transporter
MQHSYEGLDRPGGFTRVRLFAPLRNRDFRLLWSGMCVSLIGDGIFFVALPWQVYKLSNVPSALAVIGIVMTLSTMAFLLLGGVISDRVDRRRVMLVADLTRCLVVGVIAALSLLGMLALWQMIVLATVYGAATAFFHPSFDAVVPELLPEEALAQANSLDQFVRPLALRLIGPAAGGALIAGLGIGIAFGVDAATFAASAVALLCMTARPRPARGQPASLTSDIGAGLSYVRRHAWLWATLASAAVAYLLFMGPTEVLVPYMVKNELHGSAADLGLVFAAGGLGSLACALVMGQRGLPKRNVTFMYIFWTLATFAVAGYGLAHALWGLMLASVAFNTLETAGTIIWATAKQSNVPASLLGRVSSLDWLVSIGLLPASFALTAPVSSALGVRATLIGAGVIGGLVTLAALFVPGVRTIEGRQQDKDAAISQPAIRQANATITT